METDPAPESLGRLWGVLRSQLGTLSVQNIMSTAGAAGFDVSQVPARSEEKTGMGSRAEVLPALDRLFNAMTVDVKARVLGALAGRLLKNNATAEQARALLDEQGFRIVEDTLELVAARSEADTDHLTGLLNRRAFETDLRGLLSASANLLRLCEGEGSHVQTWRGRVCHRSTQPYRARGRGDCRAAATHGERTISYVAQPHS